MRGVCFCEKAHFSILYTSLPSFTSCQGLSLLQMRAWSLNFTNCCIFEKKTPKGVSFSDFIAIFAMSRVRAFLAALR